MSCAACGFSPMIRMTSPAPGAVQHPPDGAEQDERQIHHRVVSEQHRPDEGNLREHRDTWIGPTGSIGAAPKFRPRKPESPASQDREGDPGRVLVGEQGEGEHPRTGATTPRRRRLRPAPPPAPDSPRTTGRRRSPRRSASCPRCPGSAPPNAPPPARHRREEQRGRGDDRAGDDRDRDVHVSAVRRGGAGSRS